MYVKCLKWNSIIFLNLRETNEVCNYQVRTSEQNGQTQYKIRDDFSFSDIPSLLSFYKRNLFKTTCLKRPVGSVVTRGHTSGKVSYIYMFISTWLFKTLCA